MAKKQRGKTRLKKKSYKQIRIYDWLYRSGFFHSLIFHTIFLLFLSILAIKESTKNPIKLVLSFSSESYSEPVSLEKPQIIEIKTNSFSKNTISDFESVNPSAIEPSVSIEMEEFTNSTSQESLDFNTKDLIKNIVGSPNNNDDFKDIVKELSGGSSDDTKVIIQNIVGALNNREGNSSNTSFESGNGDELGRRLASAGAKSGDVQISIMWNTVDDIDLHVIYTPGNGLVDNINWTNRVGRLSSGMLDIDRNASSDSLTNTPVENVFWQKGSSPKGFFTAYIHFYRSWTNNRQVPVLVRIKIGDRLEEIKATAILYQSPQEIYRFRYPN